MRSSSAERGGLIHRRTPEAAAGEIASCNARPVLAECRRMGHSRRRVHQLYEKMQFNDTPVLVGYNSDEGATFSRERTPQDYIDGVRRRYGRLRRQPAQCLSSRRNTVPKTARDLSRDAAFGWGTWTWARMQRGWESPKPTTTTSISTRTILPIRRRPDTARRTAWKWNTSSVTRRAALPGKPTATDLTISDAMATYWTNFAKYGDPNGKGMPQWPAYNDAEPGTDVLLPEPPTPGRFPNPEGLKALDAYFAWRRSPEGVRASAVEDAKPATTNVMGATVSARAHRP